MNLRELLPVPADEAINGGKTSCPTAMLIKRFGMPRAAIGENCQPPTATFWKSRMVTENVGPFKVTGHRKAVALLKESLAAVKAEKPELYASLGTAGMLCVRKVRGGSALSNHGLGLAIDFTIGGVLDPRGDDKVQRGLVELYSIMKRFGWYWGAEFRIEDAMHFEVSAEKVREWMEAGAF